MRVGSVGAVSVVLVVVACAGVGFSCGGHSTISLVWLNPTGTPVPAAHTFIRCSEFGQHTARLALSASNLGPGDGCQFAASLANLGDRSLKIFSVVEEWTPKGSPGFASCFSFSLSSGPPWEKLAAGGSYRYSFTLELLASATVACEKVVGLVDIEFTGTTN
jgi:hypothetical protein